MSPRKCLKMSKTCHWVDVPSCNRVVAPLKLCCKSHLTFESTKLQLAIMQFASARFVFRCSMVASCASYRCWTFALCAQWLLPFCWAAPSALTTMVGHLCGSFVTPSKNASCPGSEVARSKDNILKISVAFGSGAG